MIQAVIGAQFGDEGKGLLVDYLSDEQTLVVRHNGGSQAGHTVVTPDGKRHEFHHFGAGSFRSASTLLSRFFIVNPIIFRQEYEVLRPEGIRVAVDRRAPVTTPFDMMLNVAAENWRGEERHGTCGLGINETVTRTIDGQPLTVGDLTDCRSYLRGWLEHLREHYVPRRATMHGIAVPVAAHRDGLIDRFLEDCEFFMDHVDHADDASAIRNTERVVFEGAQGLRLDEYAPGFPHVTRSRTGLTNILTLLQEAGRSGEPVQVHYVTRCYVTRHGAGPLTGELIGHPWEWDGQETNKWNSDQGHFRYAALDAEELKQAIARDLAQVTSSFDIRPSLVVTCLDQSHGIFDKTEAQAVAHDVGIRLAAVSFGPTRADVHALVNGGWWIGEPREVGPGHYRQDVQYPINRSEGG